MISTNEYRYLQGSALAENKQTFFKLKENSLHDIQKISVQNYIERSYSW